MTSRTPIRRQAMIVLSNISLFTLIARTTLCRCAGLSSSHNPWQTHLYDVQNVSPSTLEALAQPDNPPLPHPVLNTDGHIGLQQTQHHIRIYEGYPIPGQQIPVQQIPAALHSLLDASTYLPASHSIHVSPDKSNAYHPGNLAAYAASMREYSERFPLALDPSTRVVERPHTPIRTGIPRKRSIRPGARSAKSGVGRASQSRRSKAKDKMPTQEDEEETEVEEEEGVGGGEEAIRRFLNNEAIPPEERTKRAVRALWRRKGLWVGMPVKDLVTSITEIKLELGWDKSHSIGLITGVMVRLKRPGLGYLHMMQDQTRKVSKRIKKLNRRFDNDNAAARAAANDESDGKKEREEKWKETIYLYCRFLRSREEYRKSFQDEYNDPSDMTRINREAHRVWGVLVFLGIVPASGGIREEGGSLPMRKIEQASRSIEFLLTPHTREDIADFLRFYMAKEFHQSPAQIDVFNKARNEWLKEMQSVQHGHEV